MSAFEIVLTVAGTVVGLLLFALEVHGRKMEHRSGPERRRLAALALVLTAIVTVAIILTRRNSPNQTGRLVQDGQYRQTEVPTTSSTPTPASTTLPSTAKVQTGVTSTNRRDSTERASEAVSSNQTRSHSTPEKQREQQAETPATVNQREQERQRRLSQAEAVSPIVYVNRATKPTYPDWMFKLMHPELEVTGPTEFNIDELKLWDYSDQDSWKGRLLGALEIYTYVRTHGVLQNCLNLQDLQAIQKKKPALVYRYWKDGRYFFAWKSVAIDKNGRLHIPVLFSARTFIGDSDYPWEIGWVSMDNDQIAPIDVTPLFRR